eukprot:g17139.t1
MRSKTKLVLRNLPPAMSEAEIKEAIEEAKVPLAWFYFHPGRIRSTEGACRPSVAYVKTKTPKGVEALILTMQGRPFTSAGRPFTSAGGKSYSCVVEYALFQRVPQAPRKDKLQNTYQEDPAWLEFVAESDKEVERLPSAAKQQPEEKKETGDKPEPLPLILKEITEGNVGRKSAQSGQGAAQTKKSKALLRSEERRHRKEKQKQSRKAGKAPARSTSSSSQAAAMPIILQKNKTNASASSKSGREKSREDATQQTKTSQKSSSSSGRSTPSASKKDSSQSHSGAGDTAADKNDGGGSSKRGHGRHGRSHRDRSSHNNSAGSGGGSADGTSVSDTGDRPGSSSRAGGKSRNAK